MPCSGTVCNLIYLWWCFCVASIFLVFLIFVTHCAFNNGNLILILPHWFYLLDFSFPQWGSSTGCSKSHASHGLLGICVSWTPHFKEIVASTIPGLKPPRLLFMGASQGYRVFKSSSHTLEELQANIQLTVDRISSDKLQNVFANMIRRVHLWRT
jgi:hypothetical protein